MTRTRTAISSHPPSASGLWSVEAWHTLVARILGMTHGGGQTRVNFEPSWTGNIRWARNRPTTSGDQQANTLTIGRSVQSAGQYLTLNQLDDPALRTAIAYLERAIQDYREEYYEVPTVPPYPTEAYVHPTLWFDATIQLDGAHRTALAQQAIAAAAQAGMVSAGYLEVLAKDVAVARPAVQMSLFYPVTEAQYSLTVRDPQGNGSGWAGVSWNDWTRIDTAALTAVALTKCLTSRHPVAVEPGRYTTILEPQAVYDFTRLLVQDKRFLGLGPEVMQKDLPFHDASRPTKTMLGERVLDPRLTLRADPMDPDLGFVPFDENGAPYRPAVWIGQGVLTNLSYDAEPGQVGLLNSGAYRLEGNSPPTTMEEMIATTTRGLLVTRLYDVEIGDLRSMTETGWTRDGLWLIEHGTISHPVKNFRFRESMLAALNAVEQIGVPQRVFCPGTAAVVPPLKIKDFTFTMLTDAI